MTPHVPAPIPAANAAFPLSDASRAKQANAKWKAILADAHPELADVDAPPRVKFIQTGKDCVDRTNFHEPLFLRHAERKAAARIAELNERAHEDQREDLRLKEKRRDIYAFNTQLNMDRRSLAVGQRVNTERLQELFDVFNAQPDDSTASELPHWTNTPSTEEDACEDELPIPDWLAKIGSLYVPLGGSTVADGVWIYTTAADIPPASTAKSVPLPQHYNQARVSQLWPV